MSEAAINCPHLDGVKACPDCIIADLRSALDYHRRRAIETSVRIDRLLARIRILERVADLTAKVNPMGSVENARARDAALSALALDPL